MYKRLNIPPRLKPVWVQQQFSKDGAEIRKVVTIGNTVWHLHYAMDVLPGSPPPPDTLLTDPVYLQMMQ